MILLITQKADKTISNLINWLNYFKIAFFRFNEEDLVEDIIISVNNYQFQFEIKLNNKKILNSSDIKAVYFRGGQFFPNKLFFENLLPVYIKYLKEEWEVINFFLMEYFENLPCLGGFFQETQNNKIKNLIEAKKKGLKIPETIISSNFENNLFKNNNEIITKVLKKEIYYCDNDFCYFGEGSVRFTKNEIQKYTNKFFPAQFQECITKKFEIRTFYLLGETYSMAIIPSKKNINEHENIDYRIHNQSNYLKYYINTAYKLPKPIEHKLEKLMKSLNLKIGSIDFIVNELNEYIFLEINPVGQYDWISKICNYNLDKKITDKLIKMNHAANKI